MEVQLLSAVTHRREAETGHGCVCVCRCGMSRDAYRIMTHMSVAIAANVIRPLAILQAGSSAFTTYNCAVEIHRGAGASSGSGWPVTGAGVVTDLHSRGGGRRRLPTPRRNRRQCQRESWERESGV